jgi:hypothetical protein
MSTGQTILTIAAFMFLTTILTNFYRIVAQTGDTITSGQDGILATTVTTSYMEIAQGLSFDEVTDTSHVGLANASTLTAPVSLHAEAGEDSLFEYDDFDDFNGLSIEKTATGSDKRYRTTFTVQYVNPANVGQYSSVRTFVKRMDLKTWRINPVAPAGTELDTARMSLVMGYFHFD